MALDENGYLLLQQGQNKLYMLLRNDKIFHLVTVDRRLTEEVEMKLMQIYPCSNVVLRELGINFQTISPRGVAIGGNEAGDSVILYIGNEKRKFVLSDDYDWEQLDAVFACVEKFQPPKNTRKKNPDVWRLTEQDPKKVPVMKIIKTVLTAVSIGSSILILFDPLWSVLGILSSIVCAVLDILYPAYYTLLDMGKGRKQKHAIGLGLAAGLPIMAQALYVMYMFNYTVWWEIWLLSLAVGILSGGVIGFLAKEFKGQSDALIALFLMLILFCQGPVGLINYLADRSEPYTYMVQIEDMHISNGSKSGDRYYCTIRLEDGAEIDLQIRRSQYEELEIGESIDVAIRSGGLGIEYIALVEE